MKTLAALFGLSLVWMALGASFTVLNLLLGFAVAALALHLSGVSGRMPRMRLLPLARLAVLFAHELLLSTATVVRAVVKPRLDVKPGLVAVPLSLERDGEISLLACLVTLTPGTLSVDLSEDRRTLLVHALDASDPAGLRRDIQEGFESAIRRAFP